MSCARHLALPLLLITLGVGAAEPEAPRLEFAFEERVSLSPAVVVGETAYGPRQYIPILGGTVSGPKLKGQIVPGGWDYQLGLPNGCKTLVADYFLKAQDGTLIHVVNQGMLCPPGSSGERSFFRPVVEAPKGPHEWLNRATFVATIEPEANPAGATELRGIRIRFYQVK